MSKNDLLDRLIKSVEQAEKDKKEGCIRLPFKQVQTIEVHSEANEEVSCVQVGQGDRGLNTETLCPRNYGSYLNKLEIREAGIKD